MELTAGNIQKFQTDIFDWWNKNKRDLPWRKTSDPYSIIISEVMLQQTQVSRVAPAYTAFLREFPTVTDLSRAPVSKVLIAWKGMGYNRRALYLQKMAKVIVDKYSGVFPADEKQLMELPGVGVYTSRAVLVFAFRHDIAMVDTNIRQIIEYYFFGNIKQKEKKIQEIAERLVPTGKAWEWHQALMDYGALKMPAVRGPRKRNAGNKKNIPFRDTARFIRGRIIDILRISHVPESMLIDEVIKETGKSDDRIQEELYNLISEGLVEKLPSGLIGLPG